MIKYIYIHIFIYPPYFVACTHTDVCIYAKPVSADLSESPSPSPGHVPKPSKAQPTAPIGSTTGRPAKAGYQPTPEPVAYGKVGLPCPCAPSLPRPPASGAGERLGRARAARGRGHGRGEHRQPQDPGGAEQISLPGQHAGC